MPNIHIDRQGQSVTLWPATEELSKSDDHQRVVAQKRDDLKRLLRGIIDRIASKNTANGSIRRLMMSDADVKSSMAIQGDNDGIEGQIQLNKSQFIPDFYVKQWLLDGPEKDKIALLFANLISSGAVVTVKRARVDDESGFIVYY
jgi:hypothetical protein